MLGGGSRRKRDRISILSDSAGAAAPPEVPPFSHIIDDLQTRKETALGCQKLHDNLLSSRPAVVFSVLACKGQVR